MGTPLEKEKPVMTTTHFAPPTPGTAFSGAASALYTLQADDDAYEQLHPDAGVTAGGESWVYFPEAATVTLNEAGAPAATVAAPAAWSDMAHGSRGRGA
jgi:hypothetical protein